MISKKAFSQLCEQVHLLAKEVERIDRQLDPEGPSGWVLRQSTTIANNISKLLEDQGS